MLQRVRNLPDVFRGKSTEHILYFVSIGCLLGIGAIFFLGHIIAQRTGISGMYICRMKRQFGIPCPGCGGTRALWYLLHGNVMTAIYYNAFVVVGAVWYLAFFVSQTAKRLLEKVGIYIQGMKFRMQLWYFALVVLVVQYLLKLLIPGYTV